MDKHAKMIQKLILEINKALEFKFVDIDDDKFINYICGLTGMSKGEYFRFMELKRPQENNREWFEKYEDCRHYSIEYENNCAIFDHDSYCSFCDKGGVKRKISPSPQCRKCIELELGYAGGSYDEVSIYRM